MKKILKVTSVLGIATLVKIFAGVARAKFLAWQIGPQGIGLVGQALMYSMFTVELCSLNLGLGITKNISEDFLQKNDRRVLLTVNTARSLQFIAAILFIVLVLPFSKGLTKFVFTDSKYWIYFIGITLVTPFAIHLSGLAAPILFGLRKVKEYTRLMILYTLIGLGVVFILVPFLKSEGMLFQIIVISVIGFSLSSYFIRRMALKPKLKFKLYSDTESRRMTSQLFQYGLISFIPGVVSTGTLLYLRGLFIKQYGIEANGYYQVAYALSAYYLPFVMNGLWGYFYPEMCTLKTTRDINRELNQFIRFTIFASTIIVSGLIIFRKYIILALYTSKFLKAYDLLAIQGIGDIFFVLFCMFGTSLIARRKFKGVILISTLGYNTMLLVLYYTLSNFSLWSFRSLNMAIALTNVSFVFVFLVYYKVSTNLILSKMNIKLFIKSMLLVAIIYFLPSTNIMLFALKIALSLVWLISAVTRSDARKFLGFIFDSFKRNNNE